MGTADAVHIYTSDHRRGLRTELRTVACAKCLTEGLRLPTRDTVKCQTASVP